MEIQSKDMRFIKTYVDKHLSRGIMLLSILSLLFGTINPLTAQICDKALPNNTNAFFPFIAVSNESCPGASDGQWQFAAYDLFCSQVGAPAYPYNYSIYLNNVWLTDGTATACGFGFSTPFSIPNLTAGDIVALSTCGNAGEHETASFTTIIEPTGLPNEILINPTPTGAICNGLPLTLSASEVASGNADWNTSMTYQWTVGGAPIPG